MSEWIEWKGGETPPNGFVKMIKRRDGAEVDARYATDWRHAHGDFDIVAYQPEDEIDSRFASAHFGHDLKVGDLHEALTFHPLQVVDVMGSTVRADIPGAARRDWDRPGYDTEPTRGREGDGPLVGVGDISSTAKGSGARFNGGKTPIDLIPLRQVGTAFLMNRGLTNYQMNAARALQHIGDYQARVRGIEALFDAMLALAPDDLEQAWKECSDVFDYGRKKYAAWNWAKGMAWSIPIACAGRHIVWGILAGEVDDPESGKPHRGHVYCNLVMLIAYASCFQEGDDRPAAGMIGAAPAANDGSSQEAA